MHKQMDDYHIFFFQYIKSTSHVREPNTFSRDLVVIRNIKLSTFFFQMAHVSRTKCCIAYCRPWHEILFSYTRYSISYYLIYDLENEQSCSNLELISLLKVNNHGQYFRIKLKALRILVCVTVGCMDGLSLVAHSHSPWFYASSIPRAQRLKHGLLIMWKPRLKKTKIRKQSSRLQALKAALPTRL